ncbi:MAG: DUF2335 domain-containing protein [Parachlamydiales bacterium]|nr:DUF2335 domain-containing protein [Candidatus Acheromyda pituitae]
MTKNDQEIKEKNHTPISFAPKPNFIPNEPQKNSEQQSITSFASYSGPIPPPNFLIEYERMVPGIAKKFLEEPQIESEHRRAIEKMIAQEQVKLANRGQIMACTIAAVCVIGSFTAIFSGHDIWGLGALLLSIGAFVSVFIYGKSHKSK